jgi:hypothetical protein
MPFRVTGFSTPFGGVSWEKTASPKERITELFLFLESRRVLTNPAHMEVIEQCVESSCKIREALVSVIKGVNFTENDVLVIKTMIDGCNEFLDELNVIEKRVGRIVCGGRVNIFEFALSKFRESMIAGIRYFEKEYGVEFSKDLSNVKPDRKTRTVNQDSGGALLSV